VGTSERKNVTALSVSNTSSMWGGKMLLKHGYHGLTMDRIAERLSTQSIVISISPRKRICFAPYQLSF